MGSGTRFHGNFRGNVTWLFAFFSGVRYWIVLILVWFERSFPSAQVSGQSYPWLLKLMTSQAVERTRIRTGGYWPLRGECVKINYILEQNLPKFQWLLMICILLNFYWFGRLELLVQSVFRRHFCSNPWRSFAPPPLPSPQSIPLNTSLKSNQYRRHRW